MITFENVVRKYGNYTAVDDISFTIPQGEIVGLLGHNGAGKTTILKMLTGYLEPTQGTISINGCDVVRERHRIQKELGYLPENCPIYPEMTVIDFLDYTASLHGINGNDRPKLIGEAISQTALKEKAHQRISTLSRGYRQRTGVAQALLHRPRILILDEPTNGLDPTQIQQMRELIKRLAKQATVIVSTHILQEVQAICDRVIIVQSGKVALDTRLDALQSQKKILLSLGTTAQHPETVLSGIDGVEKIVQVTDGQMEQSAVNLGLHLTAECSNNSTAAEVARVVHEQGWFLYRLQFESRDLETVFTQLSER